MKRGTALLHIPSSYSIYRDKSNSQYDYTMNIPKVFAFRDGAFYLQCGKLFVVKKDFPPIIIAHEVEDMDFDDNMLMALSHDGSLTAWKGDIGGYIDGPNEDDNCRQLYKFEAHDDEATHLPRMIAFRGDAGVICVLAQKSVQMVKIDIDLNITLSEALPVPGPIHPFICEPIKKCTIWGVNDLFLVYSVDGSILYIIKMDAVDVTAPCSLVEVYDHQAWVTALSSGPSTICASGDANGGITLWNTYSKGNIEKLFYVSSLASTAVTALAVVVDSMLWVGLADGSIISAQFDTQNPVLLQVHTLNIFAVGAADVLSWEPAHATAPASPSAKKSCMSGMLLTSCFASGTISQIDISQATDSIFNVYPQALTEHQNCTHKLYVSCCLHLPLLDVLVIADFRAHVKLWSVGSTQFIRDIIVSEYSGDKVKSITGFEIMADGGSVDATLFLGMYSGKVIQCNVSVSASRHNRSRCCSAKAEESFSVLDLLESTAKTIRTRELGPENDDDTAAEVFSDDDLTGADGAVHSAVTGGNTVFSKESVVEEEFTVLHTELAIGGGFTPPIPVSDLFVSSLASVLCVCHARCALHIHSLDLNTPMLNIDLDYHDLVDISTVQYSGREISESTSPAKDRLLLALMGKSVVKILDAIQGKIIAQLSISLPQHLKPSETVQYCGMWDSLPRSPESSNESLSSRFVAVVVTNKLGVYVTGKHVETRLVYDHGDLSAPVMKSRVIPDLLYCVPTGLTMFKAWSANIVCISTFRELVFLKFDFAQADPVVTKSHRVQLSDEKVRIINTSVVEANSSNRKNRLLIVLSDGTSFVLKM